MPENRASNGVVGAGYVSAVLLPVVGFFVGLALILKNRAAHGIATMTLSVVIGGIAATLVVGGGTASTASECPRAYRYVGSDWCIEGWRELQKADLQAGKGDSTSTV